MQSSRVMAGVLAGLISMPSAFAGHLLRSGNYTLAWKLLPAIVLVILISAAIMRERKHS
jgi:hypothetical protein